MSRKLRHARAAFTLLELVVVLAILAVVTTLAVRSLDGLEDQGRYEKNVHGFEELSAAVLGSPDDRAADGTRTVSGFVADMGRLPRTVADGSGELTLAELWQYPGDNFKFDVRQASVANGVPATLIDPQVYVAGGWRGPYLRLPTGAATWLDGWGNPMSSPAASSPGDPNGIGYARLRNTNDLPINAAGEEIRIIRHLGANGRFDPLDPGYDRDDKLSFTDGFTSTLTVQVKVVDIDPPITPIPSGTVTICLFGPDPANSGKILVQQTDPAQLAFTVTEDPTTGVFPGLTIGSRVVRAYFNVATTTASALDKSAVKNITLRPGANFVELTIDR